MNNPMNKLSLFVYNFCTAQNRHNGFYLESPVIISNQTIYKDNIIIGNWILIGNYTLYEWIPGEIYPIQKKNN